MVDLKNNFHLKILMPFSAPVLKRQNYPDLGFIVGDCDYKNGVYLLWLRSYGTFREPISKNKAKEKDCRM